ncbi:MAG: hypothetical protein NVSMB17_12330 [Candidatus Dormibacteria bacterium]
MIRRAQGGRHGGQEGQAVLEFALSLGVLGALLMGSLSLGRYAYDRMIVREAVEESAKMAMIDRPRDGKSWQMSNADLLEWQRTAASEMDHTIKHDDIRPIPGSEPWKYSDSAHATPGANGAPGLISQLVAKVNGFLSNASLPTISQAGFTRAINPGAETMRVMFRYNSGLSTDWNFDSEIDFDFTRYTMFTLPFSPEERGDFPGNH